jgi:hypothetical protein
VQRNFDFVVARSRYVWRESRGSVRRVRDSVNTTGYGSARKSPDSVNLIDIDFAGASLARDCLAAPTLGPWERLFPWGHLALSCPCRDIHPMLDAVQWNGHRCNYSVSSDCHC